MGFTIGGGVCVHSPDNAKRLYLSYRVLFIPGSGLLECRRNIQRFPQCRGGLKPLNEMSREKVRNIPLFQFLAWCVALPGLFVYAFGPYPVTALSLALNSTSSVERVIVRGKTESSRNFTCRTQIEITIPGLEIQDRFCNPSPELLARVQQGDELMMDAQVGKLGIKGIQLYYRE